MSFSGFDDTTPAWDVPTSSSEDIVTTAIKKEKLIKYVESGQLRIRRLTSLLHLQGNCCCSGRSAWLVHNRAVSRCLTKALLAMISKAKSVQADVDKLISGNETLQMYIDNLTMQMAKRR